ncbi:MAG: hypothetical protein AAB907_03885 [Patescibacteria group bacterium]
MKKFKIIATPPGQAPEWVRKEWVGLELPISISVPGGIELFTSIPSGIFGGPSENDGGYIADGLTAVDLLATKSPAAATWWRQNAPHVLHGQLVFKKEVCELV